MSEPIPQPLFDEMMARAGLSLTPEERDRIQAASRYIVAAVARIRTPRGLEAESAAVFLPE
jgi:hypothetical protein